MKLKMNRFQKWKYKRIVKRIAAEQNRIQIAIVRNRLREEAMWEKAFDTFKSQLDGNSYQEHSKNNYLSVDSTTGQLSVLKKSDTMKGVTDFLNHIFQMGEVGSDETGESKEQLIH